MTLRLYRILNSTVYTVLSFVLFCLILFTPADFIYQCYKRRRLTNIFTVTGAYIITILLATLIYASRIYTNRTTLAGIPKAWIPVGKGDVGKSVKQLVAEGFTRSAIIAYQARPRDLPHERVEPVHDKALSINRDRPPWGHISHPGWSSPSSPDLPDLRYQSVIQELPHLIEAKAVSLAPPDPASQRLADPFTLLSARDEQPLPDPRVVEILQRPAVMGLREYIGHLIALNLIEPPALGMEFLTLYERARFSSHELYEDEFRTLMGVFAEILRNMKSIDPRLVGGSRADSFLENSESFIGPSDEEGETDTADFDEVDEPLSESNSFAWESSILSVHTAPMIQGSSSPALSRSSDTSRSSSRSIIRLTEPRSSLDLPYTIELPGRWR
jgi:hypothetical protein